MRKNEKELVEIIMNSNSPESAMKIAIKVITSYLATSKRIQTMSRTEQDNDSLQKT